MSTIITRSTGSNPKGAPLTAGELDQNFINLNADKVESTRAVNTTAGDLTGGGDLSGDRTLGLASTGISAGTVNNSNTQVTPLTLDIKGRVTGVGTPQTITPAFSSLTGTPTTLAGYGIADAQATITGAATTIDTEDLTASKVLVSNASGKVAASDISTTTLGYLDATSSVQGQLDSKQATTAKNAANGYAGLDADAKLPTSLLPALAISEYLGSVANQAARLALTGQKGDWCSQTDNGKVYVITGDDPSDNANWTALTYPVTPGITLNGTSIAPGDTATISAATTNTLTIGTGLSGTSFNGSAATTIAIDSSVVTLTGTQTLTNKTLTSPTINGGTVNNVAIGGTTPAAGNFTTLGATGDTTLGDQNTDTLTINGTAVSCPNNLNFDSNTLFIDAANNRIGIGTSNPFYKLHVRGADATANLVVGNTAEDTRLEVLTYQDDRVVLRSNDSSNTARSLAFETGTTERMRLDSSGNLGLGTPSALSRIDARAASAAMGYYQTIQAFSTNTSAAVDLGGGISLGGFYNSTQIAQFASIVGRKANGTDGNYDGYLAFGTNAQATGVVERLRIDSSGNLLLNTTSAVAGSKLVVASGDANINGLTVGKGGGSVSTNTANGYQALLNNTTGDRNTANGYQALFYNTTGSGNTANGYVALYFNTTGSYNTANGLNALRNNTTGSGNTAINPSNSSGSYAPVFDPTTENNRFCMGSTGVTNAYIQVAWTVVSDARDKTDFATVPHGLDFVIKLSPTAYRYKMSRDSVEGHGPVRYGFKAQDVLALEGDNPVIVDAEDADKLRFNDQSMLAVLVNAIKELNTEVQTLKAEVAVMKGL